MKTEEQIVRSAKPFGNGAHIFVPKEWAGEQIVLIRPQRKSAKDRILSVLSPHLDSVIGAYLYGSYARGEQTEDSDVDLFIISDKKINFKAEGFEIVCLEQKNIEKAIKLEPLLLYSILSEASPIINSKLLEELRTSHKPKPSDFKTFLRDCKRIIKINQDFMSTEKSEYISSEAVIYSSVLRLRGVFIIKSLLDGKKYSHKFFRSWVEEKTGVDFNPIYLAYKSSKSEKKIKQKIRLQDVLLLLELLINEVSRLENA